MGRWRAPQARDGGVPPRQRRLAPPYPSTMLRMVPLPIWPAAKWEGSKRPVFATKSLSATVSKGTYIRSLARDIALALNTVGHVTMLRRTKAGPFTLERAISLDFLGDAAKARQLTRTVLPLEAGLDDIPGLPVTPEQAQLLRHGQQLFGNPVTPGLHLAMDGITPVALVESDGSAIKVVRGFNL
jgi:tRNA pseudouridine55 synthase